MSKLIIDNRSTLEDTHAIDIVLQVMYKGRISKDGKQYCYATLFIIDGKEYGVYTDLNKSSDRFVVMDIEKD